LLLRPDQVGSRLGHAPLEVMPLTHVGSSFCRGSAHDLGRSSRRRCREGEAPGRAHPGQRGRCGCCALQSAQLGVVPAEAAGTPYRTRPRVRTFGAVPIRHWGN